MILKRNIEGKVIVVCEVDNKESGRILSCGLVKKSR